MHSTLLRRDRSRWRGNSRRLRSSTAGGRARHRPARLSSGNLHKKASEIRSRALLELPLILLVKGTQRLTRADQLWGRDKIEETLITFRRSDPVSIHFQLGLEQLGVEWFPGIEVNSARLIECYVAHGYGIGLTVATPGFKAPKGIRALKLTNFPKVMIGAAWTGKLSAIAQQFLAEVEIEATVVKRSTKLH
ncbi:MAG: hypothetical protein DME40_00505 [Verrucomicrobia bacterium]|nr:MAG: hypothetical protein DME40_00505 [Verrucomicrobiota bacterium]